MAWTQARLEKLIQQSDAWLLRQPGVTAVGIGLDAGGKPCLEISTDGLAPEIRQRVEEAWPGVPLRFVHTGPIDAL